MDIANKINYCVQGVTHLALKGYVQWVTPFTLSLNSMENIKFKSTKGSYEFHFEGGFVYDISKFRCSEEWELEWWLRHLKEKNWWSKQLKDKFIKSFKKEDGPKKDVR